MERAIPLWVVLWLLSLCLVLWILFAMAFGWAVKSTVSGKDRAGVFGVAAVKVASFPGITKDAVTEIYEYISGDFRDTRIRVLREENSDYSDFEPIPAVSEIDVPGLLMRANREKMAHGWRILAGFLQINDIVDNTILLISPELKIVRAWVLDEIPLGDREPRRAYRKFVHGVEILPDSSVVFTFDGSISLQRFNACGEREWAIPGKYHHAVTLDDTADTVWTFESGDTGGVFQKYDDKIVQVAVDDGTVIRRIDIGEIISANPDIDILELRRKHESDHGVNSRDTTGYWLSDPWHFNDVDPLPAAFADQFEMFNAGDLLLSSRSLNLVFVMDPETLQIKWWRMGAVQRQHDPDWLESGEIMVFNNRMSRDFSEIVTLDPENLEKRMLLDGREHDFYTRIRGKHQMLDNGTLVVTSSQQGRAFEVGPDGERVFEVINTKPGSEDTNYTISELRWLPPDYFGEELPPC